MNFGLKFVSIASIAGVLAWAASAAPLQPSGEAQNGAGYGYGGGKVTLCHIPPGNPGNAHTITVGAPAVPAHLAHGDTLGPCPQVAAAQNTGTQEETNKGKGKSQQSETPTADSTTTTTETTPGQSKPKKEKPAQSNSSPASGNGNGNAGGNGNGNAGGNGNGEANGHK